MLAAFLAAFLIPLLVSAAGAALLIRLAPRIGLVDRPAARKVHTRVVPLGGGVAIYLGVMLAMAGVLGGAWAVHAHPEWTERIPESLRRHAPGVLSKAKLVLALAAAGTVQMLLGLADDWRRGGLDYRLRLLIETGLVAWLVTQGVALRLPMAPAWLAGVVTVVWVVGLTNAINFLDNMDGLAGGVTFLAALFFALVMALVGAWFVAGAFFIVAGATLGFLGHNWHPAKIFMGDAGSNFLGFWLGVLTVLGTFLVTPFSPLTLCAPLCILAVPIYDSVSVISLRLFQGRSPFQADKQHFSHRLTLLGLSPKSAVLLIYLVTGATGLAGLLLYFLDQNNAAIGAPLVVAQVIAMLSVIALLEISAHRRTGLLRGDGSP